MDGNNVTYTTSQAMRLDRVVDVFVNGCCRMAALDNGYVLQDAQTVVLKEPLLSGDTISVRYNCSPVEVGVPGAKPEGVVVDCGRLSAPSASAVLGDPLVLHTSLACPPANALSIAGGIGLIASPAAGDPGAFRIVVRPCC